MEKSTGQAVVADADDEIPGDHRRRAVGYVVIELFEFSFRLGVEDDPVLHLPTWLSPASRGDAPRAAKNRLGRNAPVPLEFAQARRYFLTQPSFPLRLEILEHTQPCANNLTGIVVAALFQLLPDEALMMVVQGVVGHGNLPEKSGARSGPIAIAIINSAPVYTATLHAYDSQAGGLSVPGSAA